MPKRATTRSAGMRSISAMVDLRPDVQNDLRLAKTLIRPVPARHRPAFGSRRGGLDVEVVEEPVEDEERTGRHR